MRIEFDSINGTANIAHHRKSTILKYPCKTSDFCAPYKVTFLKGTYRIELWGASAVGRGGYTRGDIHFNKEETFYFHIGASWGRYNSVPPFACIISGSLGGGATDMRYSPNIYYDFDSLKTRIMVAAGSSTWEHLKGTGMNAGGLIGEDGNSTYTSGNEVYYRISSGANQTSGGNANSGVFFKGRFGIAGYTNETRDWGASGGGGYYGGTSTNSAGSSGGGSSFISGYEGCDAIYEDSTFDNIKHSHQPIHYSRFVFFNSLMLSGKEKMPRPTGNSETGHFGNGTVRITPLMILAEHRTCGKRKNNMPFFLFIIQLISI